MKENQDIDYPLSTLYSVIHTSISVNYTDNPY